MKLKYYHKPQFTEKQKKKFVKSLREVAETCFTEIPIYQALDYNFDFSKSVITTIEDQGRVVGFSSGLELLDEATRPFLHLGLTCVHENYRGRRLTHKLAGNLTIRYLLKTNPFGKIRFTNVACVLSSLGNIAKNFENVFPSPTVLQPDKEALKMARAVEKEYRSWIHLPYESDFSYDSFVFKESALDMFHKSTTDTEYYHREEKYNDYYTSIMNIDEGDEVLQTGYFSLWTFIKYLF